MAQLQRARGQKVTRRLTNPHLVPSTREPGKKAHALAWLHNAAVREYGSNSGGFHAFDPDTQTTAGVYDEGPFPDGTVVSRLEWGQLSAEEAQRLLEGDGAA